MARRFANTPLMTGRMTQVYAAEGDKKTTHVFPRPLGGIGLTRCTPKDEGRASSKISQLPPPTIQERNPLSGHTCHIAKRRAVSTEFDQDVGVQFLAPFMFPSAVYNTDKKATRSRAPSSGNASLYSRTRSVSFKVENAFAFEHLELESAAIKTTCKIAKDVAHAPLRSRRESWECEKLLIQQMSELGLSVPPVNIFAC